MEHDIMFTLDGGWGLRWNFRHRWFIFHYPKRDAEHFPITHGQRGFLAVPFDCLMTGVSMETDIQEELQVDVWKQVTQNNLEYLFSALASKGKKDIETNMKRGDILVFSVNGDSMVHTCSIHIKAQTKS